MSDGHHHDHHFLLIAYHVHSHINPALQLAHRLLNLGSKVTFATSTSAVHRITSQPNNFNNNNNNIDFVELPDNFIKGFSLDDENEQEQDLAKLEIRQNCSAIFAQLISTSNENGCPVTCSVYTPTVPWVMNMVQHLPKPTVLLWTQPAAVLVLYYYFFFGFRDAMLELFVTKSSIRLPGLPCLLESPDLPTFMRPANMNNPHPWAIKLFELQTKWIAVKENSNILINTFESLEPEALKAVKELNMVPIGPLVPLDGIEIRSDADSYIRWLDAKEEGSVVYVSFGSIWDLSNDQMEEIGRALLDVGRPFLWIVRALEKQNDEAGEDKDKVKEMSCLKELEQLGLIIPWCIQLEVLSHKSIGCFVTHCGWNSTLESLVSGVPMVGMPLWVEQVTNAKLIEEYWKCGVKACCSNENGLVERDEIKRCLELVMGDEGMRESAGKWKELAAGATVGNGPADENLSRFVAGLKESVSAD